MDTFFTAASTTCVTGLYVIPLTHFTFFGQCVILALIQIGGLGLMTLSFFLVSIVLKMGMATKLVAGQMLDFELWGRIKTFLVLIIGLTFAIELLGAALLYPTFNAMFNTHDALFYSFFHSVSAFCNAGITPLENGMRPYAGHPFFLIVLSMLVIAGGIGFVVWYDMYKFLVRTGRKLFLGRNAKYVAQMQGKQSVHALCLHSKIVLLTTGILLSVGTVVIWLIERTNTLANPGGFHAFVNAFFCSVSARSAGFTLVDFSQASHATLLLILVLMFVGASPGSTGAGIKTSTFALFCASVLAIFRNREEVEIFGRTIPSDQLYKVMAIVTIASSWIGITTFIMLVVEKDFTFMQILFETVSSFATCGFSTGITSQLSLIGKGILILNMFLGRIGTLTLVLALRRDKTRSLYRYPEEKVIIG